MWMRHVLLHSTIDTPSHTPAHSQLLEYTPWFNRLWALESKKGNKDWHFHFHLLSGGHRHREASPQAKQLPHILVGFWQLLRDVIRRVQKTTISDDCNTRWIRWQSQSPRSMARTMQNGQPRWPYFSNRSKCLVASRDTMTSQNRQQQMRPLQRRPLSNTGWIAMLLADRLSCWAWSRGYKRPIWSSRMRRCFGRSLHQPTTECGSSTSLGLGKTFGASSYRTLEISTITHCGSIRKSRMTICGPGQRPMSPTLPTPMQMQSQSPRWVSSNTSSTSYKESPETTTGKPSWSSWWTKRHDDCHVPRDRYQACWKGICNQERQWARSRSSAACKERWQMQQRLQSWQQSKEG